MGSGFWVSRYELVSAAGLNARTERRVYEGALVWDGVGYGCLHSWPELGDADLEGCLADLVGAQEFPLVRRTLACMAVDGAARVEGRSLWEGVKVPRSHATLTCFDEGAVERALVAGFLVMKVKVGREVTRELAFLRECCVRWPEVRWRVDFNETGDVEELCEIFASWSEEELASIDFLEDPLPFESGLWREFKARTGLALGNDRQVLADGGVSDFLVVKPAVMEVPAEGRIVVTSYLDHAVGQAFAAWEAGRAGVSEWCGLQTHGAFEENEFSEVLGVVQPEFTVPEGMGIGFGDLLKKLEWVRLE